MIRVVVGILTNQDGAILIAQRPLDKYCGGLWEFPGGKVEMQEDIYAALQREFLEEIGIHIISANPWFQIQYDYVDRIVLLDIWLIKEYKGTPKGAEGQIIRWIRPQYFYQYKFPEGNRKIIEKLLAHSSF